MSLRLRSVPTLAMAYGLAGAASFVLNICVGRANGAAALGDFALAVATARIFFAATDFGLTPHMTRTISRERTRAQSVLASYLTIRLTITPLAMIVTTFTGVLLGRDNPAMFCLVAVAQGIVTVQGLYESLLLSHERQTAVAVLTTTSAMCVTAGAVAWYATKTSIDIFAACYAGASAAGVALWVRWSTKHLGVRPKLVTPSRDLVREMLHSWPIGASTLLGIASLRTPLLVLGAFAHPDEVGAFSAVDMAITASAILQAAISSATFPRLAATYHNEPERFRRLFWASNAALAAFGLFVAGFLAVAGTYLLGIVFPSKDFTHVSVVMPVVVWSIPALLLVHHNIYVFAAANKEVLNLRFMLLWFALIGGLQLVAVPTYGLAGAAWALLAARTVGLIALAWFLFAARIPGGRRSTI